MVPPAGSRPRRGGTLHSPPPAPRRPSGHRCLCHLLGCRRGEVTVLGTSCPAGRIPRREGDTQGTLCPPCPHPRLRIPTAMVDEGLARPCERREPALILRDKGAQRRWRWHRSPGGVGEIGSAPAACLAVPGSGAQCDPQTNTQPHLEFTYGFTSSSRPDSSALPFHGSQGLLFLLKPCSENAHPTHHSRFLGSCTRSFSIHGLLGRR